MTLSSNDKLVLDQIAILNTNPTMFYNLQPRVHSTIEAFLQSQLAWLSFEIREDENSQLLKGISTW